MNSVFVYAHYIIYHVYVLPILGTNEFTKTRLKLTALYIFLSVILLGISSATAISAQRLAFKTIDQALSDRTQRPILTGVLERGLRDFDRRFVQTLLILNAVLLVISSVASYFLSGWTLKPIQEMLRQQEEFSAEASHELRTPLTTINMEIEALKRTESEMPTVYNIAFGQMQSEIARMKKIVEGLLTLVRIDGGVKAQEVFDLSIVCQEIVGQFKNLGVEKQQHLELLVAATKTTKIAGDKDKIKQVLVILLDNAIKYTPAGGNIKLALENKDNRVIVSVIDNGPGIAKRDLQDIFKRFYRGKHIQEKGVGLGLAIAKKLIAEQGSKLTVESVIGKGSVFSFAIAL